MLPAHTLAIYHVEPVHKETRDQVLRDIRDRRINFPTRDALKVPIVSTFTGTFATASVPLVEEVVDMVLTQVVDWDQLVSSTLDRLKSLRRTAEIFNVGPGNTLAHAFERRISAAGLDVRICDISTLKCPSPVVEPIAVVGMAIRVPGAQDAGELWELLQRGESTLSQVWVWSQLQSVLSTNFPDTGNEIRSGINSVISRFPNGFSDGKFPLKSRSI